MRKRQMNKKGFTMVELLATIVIIGVLSTMAIAAVSGIIDKSRKSQKESQEKTLEMAAKSYLQTNTERLPKAIGESRKISALDLKRVKFLKEDLKNSSGEDCMEKSFVTVRKTSKTDYTYQAELYCGDDEVQNSNDKNGPQIKILFNGINKGKIEDVTKVILSISIEGIRSGGKIVPIEGYSFSLSIKEENDPSYREVYNSGTLNGNYKEKISIEKPISDYIDITTETLVKAKVVARDVNGGYSEIESSSKANSEVALNDNTRPNCRKPKGVSDGKWIKANSNATRKITVECNDGSGSGCIREKFTRTWPNEIQSDAEYTYIQVKDNAGNVSVDDNYVNDPCSITGNVVNNCRVLVNVDKTYPKIQVESYKLDQNGNLDTSVKAFKAGTTTSVGNKKTQENGTIDFNSYNNLTNGWMNQSNYPYGIGYQVKISDTIHLASWKWETNAPHLVSGYGSYRTGKAGENSSETIADPDMKKNNCGVRSKTIMVFFKDEGLRRGRLTVTDKAGNSTVFVISAKIDRTSPPVPKVSFNKYDTSGKSVTNTAYTPNKNQWSQQSVQSRGQNPGDKVVDGGKTTLKDDLSGFQKFKCKGTNAKGESFSEEVQNFNFKGDNFEGKNKIQYSACDKAGNCSKYTGEYQVWVDTQTPTVSVSAKKGGTNTAVSNTITANNSSRSQTIANNAYTKNSSIKLSNGWMNQSNYPSGVVYTVTMNDNVGLSNYEWSAGKAGETVSATTISGKSKTIDVTLVAEGKRRGVLKVKDAAGNLITITANAWIDRTAPAKPGVTSSSNGNWTKNDIFLTLTSSDPKGSGMVGSDVSGIGKYQWKYASTNWADYAKSDKTKFVSSAYSAERNEAAFQRACDKAGNCSEQNSTMIKIDKTAPRVSNYHYFSHSYGSNSVSSVCSDTPKTVNGNSAASGIRSGNGVTKSISWGSSGTLSNTCTDNAGNSSTISRYMGYNSCLYGHPAYWDGGYCSWNPYHTYVQGACIGGYHECHTPQSGGYLCPPDVCDIVGTQCCCKWNSCQSRGPGYYVGAWEWSNYCTYHENTCRGGYA